ncbi:MAG: hypothetical protein ABWY28_18565 [Pseudomonas prosekii]
MKPNEILLRCFAERKEDYWQAFCIDLCLAVQGDSFQEVKSKLHAQVADYLQDILDGEDRPYAAQLLSRKSPLPIVAKYHLISAMNHIHRWKQKAFAFRDAMPLKLAS